MALCSIPLHAYILIYLVILLYMDIWAVSSVRDYENAAMNFLAHVF